MFILSSVSGGLEFWWVNHTLIGKNPELKFFKDIKFLGGYLIIDQTTY